MSEKRDLGFCPRCGALMQDGVCQSCGYGGRGVGGNPGAGTGSSSNQGAYPSQGQFPNQGPYQNQGGNVNYQGYPRYQQICVDPPKKSNKKGLWFAVTAAVVLILALIVAMLFYFYSIIKAGAQIGSSLPDYGYDDDYSYDDGYDDYYDYDDDYGYYEPSEEDPYYETITDCTRTDLEYKVFWVTESIDPDDYAESCSYYCIYPILKDEDEAHRFDAVNAAIREKAESYRDIYGDYSGGASTYGYVTYMDEELISIAFKHELYEEEGRMPRLDAITFHVDAGTQMQYEEMTEIDEELALRFRAQDKTQNGGVEYVQNLTDGELVEILKNPERAVMFYTPVGLEIGFNYETGWVSVTMKDRAL